MEIDMDQEKVKVDEKWYNVAELKMLIKEKVEAEEFDIQKYADAMKELKRELEAEKVITIKLPGNIFSRYGKLAREASKSIEDFLSDSLIGSLEGKGVAVAKSVEAEAEPEEAEEEEEEEEADEDDIDFEIDEDEDDEEDDEDEDEDEDEEKEPIKEINCPRCKGKVPIYTDERPLDIECPSCGKKGTLKK